MEMLSEFTIDRAGQGLFYHGIINRNGNMADPFSIVYDCGTGGSIAQIDAKKRSESLTTQIENFKQTFSGKIGLLAISHFDCDHVSHIPELIRNTGAKAVMLPHIADELRLVFWAKTLFESRNNGDDSGEFMTPRIRELEFLFRDPVGFFGEYGGQSQIIGIDGNNDGGNNDFPPYNPNDIESYEKKPFDSYPPLRYLGGSHDEPSESRLHWRNYSIHNGSPIFRLEVAHLSWLFRPLNIKENLSSEFYSDVGEILDRHSGDWSNLLLEEIDELKKIYDRYIGKRHRNAHSLLIRHEPEQNNLFFDKNKCVCKCHWINCRSCLDCARHIKRLRRPCHYRHSATLLLGDIELDGNAMAILNQNKFIDRKISVAIIPHHGADSDDVILLDTELCLNSSCNSTLAVSYGNDNKYGHPKFLYDGAITKLQSTLKFVNEEQSYCYKIISWVD